MTRVSVRERLNRPVLGSSHDIAFSTLDLFTTPPTQDDVQSEFCDKIYPVNGSLISTNPLVQFQIAPSEHWTDLSSSYLMMQVGLEKLTWPRGSDATINAANKVSLANHIGGNFWKDVALELNGHLVTVNRGLAMYESYIQLLTQTTPLSQAKWMMSG